MEPERAPSVAGVSVWGIAFIVVGLWWLLGELGYVAFDWALMGPIALIVVGAGMVLGRRGPCC